MEIPVTSARPERVLEISVREDDTFTEGKLPAVIDV